MLLWGNRSTRVLVFSIVPSDVEVTGIEETPNGFQNGTNVTDVFHRSRRSQAQFEATFVPETLLSAAFGGVKVLELPIGNSPVDLAAKKGPAREMFTSLARHCLCVTKWVKIGEQK